MLSGKVLPSMPGSRISVPGDITVAAHPIIAKIY
jgi:hypothetical protein